MTLNDIHAWRDTCVLSRASASPCHITGVEPWLNSTGLLFSSHVTLLNVLNHLIPRTTSNPFKGITKRSALNWCPCTLIDMPWQDPSIGNFPPSGRATNRPGFRCIRMPSFSTKLLLIKLWMLFVSSDTHLVHVAMLACTWKVCSFCSPFMALSEISNSYSSIHSSYCLSQSTHLIDCLNPWLAWYKRVQDYKHGQACTSHHSWNKVLFLFGLPSLRVLVFSKISYVVFVFEVLVS